MWAPLLGRAAVLAALLALSSCLTGKGSTYPELDEQIDFLSAIISEQRTESVVPVPSSQDVSSKPLSEPSFTDRGPPTEQPTSTTPTSTITPTTNHTPGLFSDPIIISYPSNDFVFIIMSSVFIVAGLLVLIVAGICWLRLQRGVRLTQKVDYPAYGVIKAQVFSNFP
ncbi:neural proliferation differentiation and control protein 1, partial [Austrofundulus limnaeus]|uniref:Neural proliferation differentiation and control protein 1 n=1 Tax=Austrofundulus limnaeus TaxID=52670 RepID=A0A2I4DD24_AUSLI